jgi:hypothetical protein
MSRPAVFAAAAVCVAALSARAAEPPDLTGTWAVNRLLHGRPTEVRVTVVKIEPKDGTLTASVAGEGEARGASVKELTVAGKEVALVLSNGTRFSGIIGTDPRMILGAYGQGLLYQERAIMVRGEKDGPPPRPSNNARQFELEAKLGRLAREAADLRAQAAGGSDAEKKPAAEIEAEIKECIQQVRALYGELIAKHANDANALDTAFGLLKSATHWQLTVEEVKTLLAAAGTMAAPHGPRFVRSAAFKAAEALSGQKEYAAIAAERLRPYAADLTDADPPAVRARVLTAYKDSLEGAGMAGELKPVAARLEEMEAKLDAEYLAAPKPFNPTPYAGRKDPAANRVAVMELFTGTDCGPCIAADLAFDALGEAYKPTDVVLLEYHIHVPQPDPLTNADTLARANYYGARPTPSTFFNGKATAGGGGTQAQSEAKFGQYAKVIAPLLEQTTPVKLRGKATRAGDRIAINVDAAGLEPSADLRLRLLVVEDTVRYVGANRLRFHHHIVRAMPGGAAGLAIEDKAMTHTATVDVATVRAGQRAYLIGFKEKNAFSLNPFLSSFFQVPELKELKVVALVQDDKTKQILQAVQLDVQGR